MTDFPSVVSRQESGARGNAVMRARYPKRVLNAWARKGGRPKDPTLAEILEMEREAAANKATTRRERRASSQSGGSQSLNR